MRLRSHVVDRVEHGEETDYLRGDGRAEASLKARGLVSVGEDGHLPPRALGDDGSECRPHLRGGRAPCRMSLPGPRAGQSHARPRTAERLGGALITYTRDTVSG